MDIVGIDISKARFDAALLVGERVRHAAFSNTETGFGQLLAWLIKQRLDPTAPLHACMEATGNWGLDLAAFLHSNDVRVSVVNPARIKAIAQRSDCEADGGKAAGGATANSPATRPTGLMPP